MLALALAIGLSAAATATPRANATPDSAATATPGPAPPPAQPAPDEIDLLPKEAAPDPAALARRRELEHKLALRRRMLQLHQFGGFLTASSMALTVVLGQVNLIDKYGGRGDTGNFYQLHRWVAVGSATIFAGTAALAVFAPSPVEKPVRLDTATLHKISMAVASAGMAAQIVLGIITASKEGQLSQRDFALAHQIVGYTTLAATLTGATVLTF